MSNMIWLRNLRPGFSKGKERKLCLLLLRVAGGMERGEKHEKGKRERSRKRTEPQT